MSSTKKTAKTTEDSVTVLQNLIAKGKKEGVLKASVLQAELEKLELSPEKIEEIYDRLDAMNIQVVAAELDPDAGDAMLLDLGDDLDPGPDLSAIED